MFISPLKKLFLIILLFLSALYVSLPNKIPLKVSLGSIKTDKEFNKPQINIKLQNFSFQKTFDIHYGLDLAGGSHLVFEADTSSLSADKKKDAVESVKNVIERRVNLYGVSEPSVQTSNFEGKDRIVVELPGIENTKEAVDLIGQTAQLSFAYVTQASDSGVLTPAGLTGADLQKSSVSFDRTSGKPAVSLSFTPDGAKKF